MKVSYKIEGLQVIQTFEHDDKSIETIYHSPYKNEESAKRRIRDLKRKDKEAAATNIGDTIKPEMTMPVPVMASMDNYIPLRKHAPTPPVEKIITPIIVGYEVPDDHGEVAKLATSSEYGKFKLDPVVFANAIVNDRRYGPMIRQVGCYPAIPKRAYQR